MSARVLRASGRVLRRVLGIVLGFAAFHLTHAAWPPLAWVLVAAALAWWVWAEFKTDPKESR